MVAGVSQGIAFRSLFTASVAALDPARRGSELSALWVIVYLGSSAPIIAVGALTRAYGLLPAVTAFAVLAAAASLALGAAVLRRRA